MKKVLFVATTAKTHINSFHLPYIQWFKKNGWIVDVATNGDAKVAYVDNEYRIDITRNPMSFSNIKACGQLIDIMKKNQYNLVTCHTPMGGVLGRIAARLTNAEKVMYTAHGFHFYKGAPLTNRIIYGTIERMLARWTDILITINNEDYHVACNFNLKKKGQVYKLDGIGVNTKSFESSDQHLAKRNLLGIKSDEIVITNIGEIIKRKNQSTIIEAFALADIANAKLLICGDGILSKKLEKLVADLNLRDRVLLLGHRTDIQDILKLSDIFVFSSYQEGLPVAVIEAMASGLPVICSNIRGCNDLINDDGGIKIHPDDVEGFADAIKIMVGDPMLRRTYGDANKRIVQKYDIAQALNVMANIVKINF